MRRQFTLPGLDQPRRTRRVLMHAADVGQAPGLMPGWRTTKGGHFLCGQCGHDAGWCFDMTDTEIRRGIPCPVCNHQKEDSDA